MIGHVAVRITARTWSLYHHQYVTVTHQGNHSWMYQETQVGAGSLNGPQAILLLAYVPEVCYSCMPHPPLYHTDTRSYFGVPLPLKNFFATHPLPFSRYSCLVTVIPFNAVRLFARFAPPSQVYLIGLYVVRDGDLAMLG